MKSLINFREDYYCLKSSCITIPFYIPIDYLISLLEKATNVYKTQVYIFEIISFEMSEKTRNTLRISVMTPRRDSLVVT